MHIRVIYMHHTFESRTGFLPFIFIHKMASLLCLPYISALSEKKKQDLHQLQLKKIIWVDKQDWV